MEADLVDAIVKLRLSIGYLGEREQFGWWSSSFFTRGSDAFLSPLFGRTQILAQCNGVTQAAGIVHDERIGVGNVYHLFRLPEDLEQNIHNALLRLEPRGFSQDRGSALEGLRRNSPHPTPTGIGPTKVGNARSLHDPKSWLIVSGLYLSAFENGVEIYPYFAGTV
mgnify:FL=1